MPLQDDMHLISVDDHLIEHPRVWLDRMPEKYQELCPQVVESGDEGMYSEFGTYVKPHSQAWRYEGRIHAQMGLNAVAGRAPRALPVPGTMARLDQPSFPPDRWDPVFSAVEDAGLPLCMPFGTSGKVPNTAPGAPMAVMISLMACNSMYAISDLIFSPVFHRHPRLRVAFSEGGIGWIPYLLDPMDGTREKHRFYQNGNQEVRPSELFRRHMWGCFITDAHGVASRHEIGIDRLLWECDYPHSDSHWPNSRKVASEQFFDVPDGEVHQIVELNARELFKFPR